jgi:Bacterial Ig-like domain (group 2)
VIRRLVATHAQRSLIFGLAFAGLHTDGLLAQHAVSTASGPHAALTATLGSAISPRAWRLSLVFSQAVPRMVTGQSFQFAVVMMGGVSAAGVRVDSAAWSSSEPAIASVSATGLVRALRQGRSFITATVGRDEVRVRVTVVGAAPAPTIASIEVTPSVGSVETGEALQFAATARTSDGSVVPGAAISWVSGDTVRARMTTDGLLQARAVGTVSVTAASGGISQAASVQVKRSAVRSITVTPASATMRTGDTLVLSATGVRRDGTIVPQSELSLTVRRGTLRGWTYKAPGTAGSDTVLVSSQDGFSTLVALQVTAPPPPSVQDTPSANTIALRIERFDGRDTAVLVTNGIPLAPGMLREANVNRIKLMVSGREVAAKAIVLRGRHKDGSLRSILLQFMAPAFSAPLTAELQLDVAPTLVRSATAAPIAAPIAVALPSSADYLISTGIVGPTIRVDQISGTAFSDWQAQFTTYGDQHWLTADVNGGANYRGDNYYDRVLNHYAFWVRGGGTKWFRRATLYAQDYLKKEALAWQPHFAQMEGVELQYWLTGDPRALQAITNQASWMMGAFPAAIVGPGGEYQEGRIQARALMALAIATELGLSGTQIAPGGVYWDYVAASKAIIEAIVGTQHPDGRRDGKECGADFPFMAGLVNNALIFYFERMDPDPRIPGLVKANLDYVWNNDWVASERAFKYWDAPTPGGICNTNDSGSNDLAAPDLNLMVVVPYGWYGKRSGNVEYIRRGDAIFDGADNRTAAYISKQFNQQYYLTYNYLFYRR